VDFEPRRRVLGGYFAGEVVSVGGRVTRFAPGDQIYGSARLRLGAYGEYVVVAERAAIAPKPRNMTFVEAAAVPLGGLNAVHFMRRASITPGEQVLVNGAGGSIGAHAVQIAHSMGAQVTETGRALSQRQSPPIGTRPLGADNALQIQSIVDRVYPMSEVIAAHRRVETEQRLGALVVTFCPPGDPASR
jgi:NADPH:quinone reductase-like Zn-dependent oxidoreductase